MRRLSNGLTFLSLIGLLAACPTEDAASTGTSAGSGGDGSTGGDPSTSVSETVTESASNSNSGGSTGDSTTSGTSGDGSTDTSAGSTSDGTTTGNGTTGGSSGSDSGGSSSSGESSSSGDESSSSTGGMADTHQLYQAAYNGAEYEFGFDDTIEILDITGAPEDTDWTRWAMLNDDGTYRLYFMQEGTEDTLYQFAYNPATQDYEYGLGAAIDVLGITGAPADADGSSFAMLYSGESYRLYMQSISDPRRVHQFVYNPDSQNYEYGLGAAFEEIDVNMFPGATDFSGWGMLWEDDTYRFYVFADAAHDAVAQGAYNSGSGDYEYGFMSIPQIDIIGFPADTNTDDFAMLHDGAEFRLYMLRQ